MRSLASVLALAALMALAIAHPSIAQTKSMEVSLGTVTVLTDENGMTLYILVRDEPGKSNCNGKCADAWPPLMVDASATPAENFSIITRDDGSNQLAYKDRPLYLFVRDEKPGDTTGEGRGYAWFVARP